jgi:hypothetical protein
LQELLCKQREVFIKWKRRQLAPTIDQLAIEQCGDGNGTWSDIALEWTLRAGVKEAAEGGIGLYIECVDAGLWRRELLAVTQRRRVSIPLTGQPLPTALALLIATPAAAKFQSP